MSFDFSAIGTTLESEEFRVGSTRLAQYAAATDDDQPDHAAGRLAPPVFANIPAMQIGVAALRRVTTLFALHGQHDIHVRQPIVPGMRLLSSATVHGVRPGPAGVAIAIRLATRTTDGAPVNEQFFTAFCAKARSEREAGERAPEHRLAPETTATPPHARFRHAMTPDHTRRYAEASRDYSDYALVEDAARARGFEHILVHGMLTFALASRAVIACGCAENPARLRRLAVRFAAPVFLVAEQAIATTLWSLENAGDRHRIGFEAADRSGRTVLAHGLAEIAA